MTIKTSIGFEFEAEKEKVLDFELSYLMGSLQNETDAEAQLPIITKMLDKLLVNKSNVSKFFDCVKKQNDGAVPNEVVTNQILEIMQLLGNDKKNSCIRMY